MEPINVVQTTHTPSRLGRCRYFFWLGVVFDTVGLVVLFIGIFSNLFFYDLLLYLGSIIIFMSLLWWVFWYTGNIEMPTEENLIFHQTFGWGSTVIMQALGQTASNVSRIRRRLALQRAASLNVPVVDHAGKEPGKEDEDKDMKNTKEIGDSQVVQAEQLSTTPEDVKTSETVHSPGLDGGPVGPSASPSQFVTQPSTHLVQPVFTPTPLDQPPGTLGFSSQVSSLPGP